MSTREEGLAACLAVGLDRPTCDEVIESRMVDGVYCDGSTIIDANGRRCITAAALERRRAAIAADPYERPELTTKLPTPSWAVPLTLSLSIRALFALADALGVE